MHGSTIDDPISGAGWTDNLQATTMNANHPVITERPVIVVDDGDVDIKIEVVGRELG